MVASAVVAAIITSIAAAGTAGATTAASSAMQEGSGVSGTIINESSRSFRITSYAPNHGHWMDHPASQVSSVNDILKMLRAEAEVLNGGKPVSDAELLTYYRDHYIKLDKDQPFVRSATTSWEMKGANVGSEGLIQLEDIKNPESLLMLMIRKIPGGDYGAGISIISKTWMRDSHALVSQDKDGSRMCRHMRNSSNKGPSTYFSEGHSITAKNGNLKVTFAGAEKIVFRIEDA